ncbi:MAG: HAD family hydrolase [Sphaerochaetaceae bacterium]|jgi:putative hydrolase of the HAD superfamily|nr:HAD family hydrolase [Spirochaetaceae bacterium]MDY6343862.1 HAD family hydrolase [Sphaerochaetaceae bacterium]
MDAEIKAVAFDVDGTLYPQRSYYWRMFLAGVKAPLLAWAYNRARRAYRIEQASRPTVPENRAGYLDRLSRLMLGSLHRKATRRSVDRMGKLVDVVFYASWRRLYQAVPERRGMRETLHALKERGYTIAVLSDFPLEGKLKALGVDDVVDVALSSEDIGYLKPDPRVFSKLVSCINLEPQEVLYVGDSYRKDVLGARGAGLHSCLITSGRKKRHLFPEAEYVVTSYSELAAL